MKIAFFTNFIPHYRTTFYEKLCRQPGFEWIIVRSLKGEPGRAAFEGNVDIPSRSVTAGIRKLGPFTLRWQRGVVRIAQEENPDAIVLLGIPGTLSNWFLLCWALVRKRKVIIWTAAWEAHRAGSVAWHIKRLLNRFYYGGADRILAYSSRAKSYLEDIGIDSSRIVICHNGIEIDHLEAQEEAVLSLAEELRKRYCPPGCRVVLYVGALVPDKRVQLLIDAFNMVTDPHDATQLWIVGAGTDRARLEEYANETNKHAIKFFGRIGDEIESYFAAADVFVLPGLGGLAFNQAMYWRTPCVGGDADGTEEDLVIEGATGFRFEPGNVASLAAAIQRAIDTPNSKLESLGENSRKLILEQSNVSRMVNTFHLCLNEIN